MLCDRITRTIADKRSKAEHMRVRLRYAHPRQKLRENRQYAAELENKLRMRMENCLDRDRHRLALYIEKMKGLSPLEKLSHGYSYVTTEDGVNVRRVSQAKAGARLRIYVQDGSYPAVVADEDK